jgi:hypothetical protein
MDLIRGAIVHDQTIWIVCALFYLFDSIRPVESRKLVLSETLNGKWIPLFPLHRYRLGGKALIFLNPLIPWLAVVQMEWLTAGAFEARRLHRSKKLLRTYRRRLAVFRVLSALLSVLLFVVGPFLTYCLGLGQALLAILPFYIVAITVLASTLIREKRVWRMSWLGIGNLVFQCAVCPGVFANICRRVSLNYIRVPGDVIAYAIVYGQLEVAASIERRLSLYLDDIDEHEPLTSKDRGNMAVYEHQLRRIIRGD